MPSRNTVREDIEQAYYHIYVRGQSKQTIFPTSADKDYFIGLFARYLSNEQGVSKTGELYPHYKDQLELLVYCLMDNHFHLMVHQAKISSLASFMKSLLTSYCRYFNNKYKRSGSIYESRYKSARITNDAYLLHISRYIHLNPRYWRRFPYSSILYYRFGDEPEWLHSQKVVEQHTDRRAYFEFLKDYDEQKQILDEIQHELANS